MDLDETDQGTVSDASLFPVLQLCVMEGIENRLHASYTFGTVETPGKPW